VAAAAATLAVGGCSSEPPDYQPAPGTLVVGTAQLTVNVQNTGTTEAVQCTPAGSLTTIMTGDQASGVSALISKKDELTAEAVAINNVGGFTGSYNAGLGGTAKVPMAGRPTTSQGRPTASTPPTPAFAPPARSQSKSPADRQNG
jgi:hypothetical protein